eukprot:gene12005-13244_t
MDRKDKNEKIPYTPTKQNDFIWDTESKEGREKIEAHIENWILLLRSGKLVCPNLTCLLEFTDPKTLISHLKACPSKEGMQQKILFRGTLPCLICGQEMLIKKYIPHFRTTHKDISENLKKIHENKPITCLNYKCAREFKDCAIYLEHCIKCKPAFRCTTCQHVYQTSVGFQKHSCTGKSKEKDSDDKERIDGSNINAEKKADSNDDRSNDELSHEWIELILTGTLSCPNKSCAKEFDFPRVFLDHLQKCTAKERVNKFIISVGLLPCLVCHNDQLIDDYMKHLSKNHKEIHESLEKLENGEVVVCANYKCQKQFNCGRDLLRHSENESNEEASYDSVVSEGHAMGVTGSFEDASETMVTQQAASKEAEDDGQLKSDAESGRFVLALSSTDSEAAGEEGRLASNVFEKISYLKSPIGRQESLDVFEKAASQLRQLRDASIKSPSQEELRGFDELKIEKQLSDRYKEKNGAGNASELTLDSPAASSSQRMSVLNSKESGIKDSVSLSDVSQSKEEIFLQYFAAEKNLSRRKRGRPKGKSKKVDSQSNTEIGIDFAGRSLDSSGLEEGVVETVVKKKRGRPKKDSSVINEVSTRTPLISGSKPAECSGKAVKKRGRPKKVSLNKEATDLDWEPCKRDVDKEAGSLASFSDGDLAGLGVPGSADESPTNRRKKKSISDLSGSRYYSDGEQFLSMRKCRRPKKDRASSDLQSEDADFALTTEDVSNSISPVKSALSVKVGMGTPKRKVGRPKKVSVSFSEASLTSTPNVATKEQRNPVLEVSDTDDHPKPLKKRGRPKKGTVSIASYSNFDSTAVKQRKSSMRTMPRNADTQQPWSLSDSEINRPLVSLSRKQSHSDNESYAKSAELKKKGDCNVDAQVSQSNITPSDLKLALLGTKSRKRGRPSKADLLLREQAAMLLKGSSGVDAEPTSPKKKKPGRKKKIESEDHAFSSKKRKSSSSVKRNKKANAENENSVELSMILNSELKDQIESWSNLFNTGVFKCPSSECEVEFAYDLARGLELDGSSVCFNCDCNKTLTAYNDCIQHGTNCASLMKCDTCQKKYKARAYFALHKNKCPNEVKEKSKSKAFFDSLDVSGQRVSAQRAIGAISKLDLNLDDSESIASTSSKRSKLTDEDFDETSVISEDIEDDLEHADDEHQHGEYDDFSGDESGVYAGSKGRTKVKSRQMRPRKNKGDSPSSLLTKSSKKPLKISTIKRMSLRPIKPDTGLLKKWFQENHSDNPFPDWMPDEGTISIVSKSEKSTYLPRSGLSPLMNVTYESRSGTQCYTDDNQIPCFQSLPSLKKSNTATFFVGGPVQALEWCPAENETGDQYIAISSHLEYSKVHTALDYEKEHGLLQIWRISARGDRRKYDAPEFVFGIVHDYGPVYSIKWCPSPCHKVDESLPMKRLGILAVAGADGLARILSIPYPEDVEDLAERKRGNKIESESDPLLVRIKSSLILASTRRSARLGHGSSKCMCIEWLPTKGHSKIAVGNGDGSICIWNLSNESKILSCGSNVLLPFTRISAHSYAVRCLHWCGSKDQYLLSGSFEKAMKVFDIYSPDQPVLVFRKAVFENLHFTLHKTGIMLTEEECFNCIPAGLRFIDLLACTSQHIPYQTTVLLTSHNAGCKGFSYSEWLDVVATSCIAGELVVKSCSGLVRTQRIPVYRIESQALEDQGSSHLTNGKEDESNADEEHSSRRNKDAISIIKNKATSLQTDMFKQKFTFKDTNFFEFRDQPLSSAEEVQRVRSVVKMQSSNMQEHETRSINKLQWNTNYGSHHMLASGGTLGIVRVHYFSDWLD